MAAGGVLTTAVIVDDHAAIVAGVRYWCEEAEPSIRLIDAGARLADVWTGPGADADVVIFDLELVPGTPDFGQLRRLVASGRRVVVYSQYADNAIATRCLDLGALTYLSKREGPEHLVPAIRAAAQGLACTAPSLSGVDVTAGRPRLKYANVGRTARTKSDLVSRALDDGVITLAELNQDACVRVSRPAWVR